MLSKNIYEISPPTHKHIVCHTYTHADMHASITATVCMNSIQKVFHFCYLHVFILFRDNRIIYAASCHLPMIVAVCGYVCVRRCGFFSVQHHNLRYENLVYMSACTMYNVSFNNNYIPDFEYIKISSVFYSSIQKRNAIEKRLSIYAIQYQNHFMHAFVQCIEFPF